jgi:serine/threonine-protein kinase
MNTPFPDALPASTALHGGDYVLGAVLGQGGFGITYRARDEVLHREAAIKEFFPRGVTRDAGTRKVLASPTGEFESAREQFLSEARALARFNHPHIADVYSVFEENATAYMVMEFVRGQTLTQLVAARGALPESEALKIIEQVGAALTAVHNAGLLHLDVKPDNVMVEDESARTVLLDFGLTKKIETASGYGTMRLNAWSRFGTPGFAAIEQYSNENRVGVFTDVYSLAAVLYFLLAGTAPPDAAARATGTLLPDVRALNAGVSTRVAKALERALRLPPDERPSSVTEFLQALHQEATAQIEVMPSHAPLPSPEYARDAFDYNDPFGARDPNRPGPWRRVRRRSFDPMKNAGPFAFLPVGFGCTSLACSVSCFLFILVFLILIACMISSVSAVFPF